MDKEFNQSCISFRFLLLHQVMLPSKGIGAWKGVGVGAGTGVGAGQEQR